MSEPGRPEPRAAPVAVVGLGCVLPGAFDAAGLWSLLVEGRSPIGPIPEGRWRAARERVLITPQQRLAGAEGSITALGSWVEGFEGRFDAGGLKLDGASLGAVDPAVRWLIEAGRQALSGAGLGPGDPRLDRAGIVFGHLAYPSAGLAQFAEAVWLGADPRPDPRNRFNAGLPADLLCAALGMGGGGFALDAACASSLYAIKLACDRLQRGEADLMLAGGLSAIDPLLLHAGFTALGAISPTGQSRPFHAEADGLLPAEGAALLALKRLEDAERSGDRVLAVIHGVGLSNDGRAGGLLAPSVEGQVRAMTQAFASAGLDPADVSLIECHATGTPLGDAAEIASMSQAYPGAAPLPIGSIKSNFGHLTTASGAVGVLKLVLALAARARPPSLHCERPAECVLQSRFRPVQVAEPWDADGPRIGAVSNFGFGGANAHLLIAEPHAALSRRTPPPKRPPPRIAVVGLGLRVADGQGAADFRRQLFAAAPRPAAKAIGFRLGEARFPPADLNRTLPQQLLILRAALDAAAEIGRLPPNTGVFVGAQTDPEACRLALRLRLPDLAPGEDPDGVLPHRLDAAATVGAMPNIPANRVNSQLDLSGPGFTLAAEELSGLRALETAIHALAAGEVEAALAGAVDLSVEPVHQAAMAAMGGAAPRPGDGAVVLVLKREADALRDGDRILALVGADEGTAAGEAIDWSPYAAQVARTFGQAHAAAGLIEAAAAVLALADRTLPPTEPNGPARTWPEGLSLRLRLQRQAMGGQSLAFAFSAPSPSSGVAAASKTSASVA